MNSNVLRTVIYLRKDPVIRDNKMKPEFMKELINWGLYNTISTMNKENDQPNHIAKTLFGHQVPAPPNQLFYGQRQNAGTNLLASECPLSQYIREAYEHTERKGHPQIA